MSDEALRVLEREVEAAGPAARVRLAREYERLGRRDDALGALLPGASDPGVRQALGALPAWSERRWLRAATGFVDVPSPASAPTAAWTAELGRTTGQGELLASPLGVVVTSPVYGHVLDATTGALRSRVHAVGGLPFLGEEPGPEALRGDVLLVRAGGYRLLAHDLWTWQLLHETRYPADWRLAGDLLVECSSRRTGGGRRSEFVAHRLVDPRRAPEPAWRLELERGDLGSVRVATRELAILEVTVTKEVHGVDARTGTVRYRAQGQVVGGDDAGVLLQSATLLRHLDPAGQTTWSVRRRVGEVAAVGPDLVLTRTGGGTAAPEGVVALDRRTGEERWRRTLAEIRATALLRDAVHVLVRDRLLSLDPAGGDVRWVATGLPRGVSYAPLGRRAYVLLHGGRVVCLRATS